MYLINNAGIFLENDTATDLSVEGWSKIINVNLSGVFLGCKYAIPQMVKQKAGSIVNTASVAGFFPARNLSAYSASKAGVIALTKAMAADYGLRILESTVSVLEKLSPRWIPSFPNGGVPVPNIPSSETMWREIAIHSSASENLKMSLARCYSSHPTNPRGLPELRSSSTVGQPPSTMRLY